MLAFARVGWRRALPSMAQVSRPAWPILRPAARGFRHHDRGWWEEEDHNVRADEPPVWNDKQAYKPVFQYVSDARKEEIYRLNVLDPKVFDVPVLALLFNLRAERIRAIIQLKADEVEKRKAGLLYTAEDHEPQFDEKGLPLDEPDSHLLLDEETPQETLEDLTLPPQFQQKRSNALYLHALAQQGQLIEDGELEDNEFDKAPELEEGQERGLLREGHEVAGSQRSADNQRSGPFGVKADGQEDHEGWEERELSEEEREKLIKEIDDAIKNLEKHEREAEEYEAAELARFEETQEKPFDQQPQPRNGWKFLEKLEEDVLEDPTFLHYHGLLALEKQRLELLLAVNRLVYDPSCSSNRSAVEQAVRDYEWRRGKFHEAFKKIRRLHHYRRAEMDEAEAKEMQQQEAALVPGLVAELKKLRLFGIVNIKDIESASNRCLEETSEMRKKTRQDVLFKAIGSRDGNNRGAKLREYIQLLHDEHRLQCELAAKEDSMFEGVRWEVLQQHRRLLRHDIELYNQVADYEDFENEVMTVLSSITEEEVEKWRKDAHDMEGAVKGSEDAHDVDMHEEKGVKESKDAHDVDVNKEEGFGWRENAHDVDVLDLLRQVLQEPHGEGREVLINTYLLRIFDHFQWEEEGQGMPDWGMFERFEIDVKDSPKGYCVDIPRLAAEISELVEQATNGAMTASDFVPGDEPPTFSEVLAYAKEDNNRLRNKHADRYVEMKGRRNAPEYNEEGRDVGDRVQKDGERTLEDKARQSAAEPRDFAAESQQERRQLEESGDLRGDTENGGNEEEMRNMTGAHEVAHWCNKIKELRVTALKSLRSEGADKDGDRRRYMLLAVLEQQLENFNHRNTKLLRRLSSELKDALPKHPEKVASAMEVVHGHLYHGEQFDTEEMLKLVRVTGLPDYVVRSKVGDVVKDGTVPKAFDTFKPEPLTQRISQDLYEAGYKSTASQKRCRAELARALEGLSLDDVKQVNEEMEVVIDAYMARSALRDAIPKVGLMPSVLPLPNPDRDELRDELRDRVWRARAILEDLRADEALYKAYAGPLEDEWVEMLEEEMLETVMDVSDDIGMELDPNLADAQQPEAYDVPSLRMRVLGDDEVAVEKDWQPFRTEKPETLTLTTPQDVQPRYYEEPEWHRHPGRPATFAFRDISKDATKTDTAIMRDGLTGRLRPATEEEEMRRTWVNKHQKWFNDRRRARQKAKPAL